MGMYSRSIAWYRCGCSWNGLVRRPPCSRSDPDRIPRSGSCGKRKPTRPRRVPATPPRPGTRRTIRERIARIISSNRESLPLRRLPQNRCANSARKAVRTSFRDTQYTILISLNRISGRQYSTLVRPFPLLYNIYPEFRRPEIL